MVTDLKVNVRRFLNCTSHVCAVLTKSRQEVDTCQLSARGRLGTQEPRRAVHCARCIDSENILSAKPVSLQVTCNVIVCTPDRNVDRVSILMMLRATKVRCCAEPTEKTQTLGNFACS